MDERQALRYLRRFDEKAGELDDSGFTKQIFSEQSGFMWSWHHEKGEETIRIGPETEAIKAFSLTLRFFIQDNEKTSLRNMAKMYEWLVSNGLVAQDVADDFYRARNKLNAHLDSEPEYGYEFDGKRLTRRDIFEVYFWGGLAHANEKYEEMLKIWRIFPLCLQITENEFVRVLATLVNTILYLREVNAKAIEQMAAQSARAS